MYVKVLALTLAIALAPTLTLALTLTSVRLDEAHAPTAEPAPLGGVNSGPALLGDVNSGNARLAAPPRAAASAVLASFEACVVRVRARVRVGVRVGGRRACPSTGRRRPA